MASDPRDLLAAQSAFIYDVFGYSNWQLWTAIVREPALRFLTTWGL